MKKTLIAGTMGALLAFGGGQVAGVSASGAGDVSGPCDEAEHANDPRCTGETAPPRGDDNPRGDDDARGDDRRERSRNRRGKDCGKHRGRGRGRGRGGDRD